MKLRIALIGLLAAALLTGCGGSEAVDVDPVAEAATKTEEAGSSRMVFTASFASGGQTGTLTGKGVFDYRKKTGRLTYDLRGLGLSGARADIDVVFEGLVFYVKVDAFSGQLPGLKPWLKMDIGKLAAAAGVDLGALSQLNQSPTQSLQYLRAVSDDVEELGKEEVRGVETTHYRGTVDLKKAADVAAKDASPEARAEARRAVEQTGLDSIPIEAWIDSDGLLRRTRVDLSGSAAGTGTVEMDLYDFGVEVEVEPPPSSQVTDLSALVGAASGAGKGTTTG